MMPQPIFCYRKRLRTTSGMERPNEEIRRRERVIRIFPNRESVIRLIGSLLIGDRRKMGKWQKVSRYGRVVGMARNSGDKSGV